MLRVHQNTLMKASMEMDHNPPFPNKLEVVQVHVSHNHVYISYLLFLIGIA